MPDTIRTLAAFTDTTTGLFRSGTGAIDAQDLRDFAVSAVGPWNAGTISGAVTLTATDLDRVHVCSGTTADYTVTLPTAGGVAGQWIGFRMAAGLTRLVTLDGTAAETIDGVATRLMWAQEAAILASDGTGWCKIAGKPRPMSAIVRRNANQTGVANTVGTPILLNASENDPVGSIVDTTNNRLIVRRTGNYLILGAVIWGNLSNNAARLRAEVYNNGLQIWGGESSGLMNTSATPLALAPAYPLTAGDLLTLKCYQDSGAPQTVYGAATGDSTRLSLVENPTW